jgi:hypothetical protein
MPKAGGMVLAQQAAFHELSKLRSEGFPPLAVGCQFAGEFEASVVAQLT